MPDFDRTQNLPGVLKFKEGVCFPAPANVALFQFMNYCYSYPKKVCQPTIDEVLRVRDEKWHNESLRLDAVCGEKLTKQAAVATVVDSSKFTTIQVVVGGLTVGSLGVIVGVVIGVLLPGNI